MVGNICTNQGVYGDYWGFSTHLYTVSAPWDASGKIERTLRGTFKATNESYYIVPSMMVHSLGRWAAFQPATGIKKGRVRARPFLAPAYTCFVSVLTTIQLTVASTTRFILFNHP